MLEKICFICLYFFFSFRFISKKNLVAEFSLNVLSLGGNRINEVPDTVGNLHQLQALSLSDNLIEVLPSSIARLSNLKTLSLHKNRIRHLPRDIITLKNLVEVRIKIDQKIDKKNQS